MKSKKIIIGSRGSKLALIYAERACSKILETSSDFEIEEVVIKKLKHLEILIRKTDYQMLVARDFF